jgi:hypothetical protein
LRFAYGLLTLVLVMLAWVWFRAADFNAGCDIIHKLFSSAGGWTLDAAQKLALGAFVGVVGVHWLMRDRDLKELGSRMPAPLLGVVLGILLALIVLSPGDNHAFIYFQF